MSIKKYLEKFVFTINDLENNNLKDFYSNGFLVSGTYQTSFFVIIVNSKGKIFFNGKNIEKNFEVDELHLLFCILLFSNQDSNNNYFDKLMGKNTKNIAKRKNNLINNLDYKLQILFALNLKPIKNFKQLDRAIIESNRNTLPSITKSISINKIPLSSYIEVSFFSRELYDMNRISEAMILSEEAYNSFKLQKIYAEYPLKSYFDVINELNLEQEDLNFIDKIKLLSTQMNAWLESFFILKESNLDIKKLNSSYKVLNNDILEIKHKLLQYIEHINNNSETLYPFDGRVLIQYFKVFDDEKNIFLLKSEDVKIKINTILNYMHNFIANDIKTSKQVHNEDKIVVIPTNLKKFNINYNGEYCKQPNWDKFIKSLEEIISIEKGAEEILCITQNFSNLLDKNNNKYAELLINNLKKGKKYYYFYPPEAIAQAIVLKNKYMDFDNIYFLEIPELFIIYEVLDHEIVIYDPYNLKSEFHSAFYINLFNSIHSENKKKTSCAYVSINSSDLFKIIDFVEVYSDFKMIRK